MSQSNELTTPSKKINLSSAVNIRREMATVYREARNGDIPVSDSTKFIYILNVIKECYVTEVLETKIEQLERIDDAKV